MADLEDLAAELDDDDDPAGYDAEADTFEPVHQFAGYVTGGPPTYDGKLLVSRYPKGVLLVDRPANRAWVLDFDAAGGLFRGRDSAGSVLDTAGRWRAAEEPNYEVRAYDPEFAGDLPPDPSDRPAGPGAAAYEGGA